MKLLFKILGFLLIALLVVFLLGPRPKFEKVNPELPDLNVPLDQLDSHISLREKFVEDLKAGNEAEIIWNDSLKTKTKYCLLYLHGFSASKMEGNPLHKDFAKRYGMNLYLPRLDDHGRASVNSFEELTPVSYMESAKDALRVASLLGDKVIVMGCSTGATLAAYLAAHHPALIEGLLFYSPNIDLYDTNSRMMLWPWGKQMLKQIEGGNYHHVDYSGSDGAMFWNSKYHTNGLIALKGLISQTMTAETFNRINQPTLICSFYKDELTHDKVVSHDAMSNFFESISTDAASKEYVKFPDAIGHVFTSDVFSDDYKDAYEVSIKFAEEKLGLSSVDKLIDIMTKQEVF